MLFFCRRRQQAGQQVDKATLCPLGCGQILQGNGIRNHLMGGLHKLKVPSFCKCILITLYLFLNYDLEWCHCDLWYICWNFGLKPRYRLIRINVDFHSFNSMHTVDLDRGHTNDEMLFIVVNLFWQQDFFAMWPQIFWIYHDQFSKKRWWKFSSL